MDDIDQKLIGLLRQDARMSIADLAHKLKVSRGTINNRLRKLEDSQVDGRIGRRQHHASGHRQFTGRAQRLRASRYQWPLGPPG
jgi:predicted transcriptional regulator